MSNHIEPQANGNSPFDAIKLTRPDGTEYWSARDLAPLMGYPRWNEFKTPLDRAMIAAGNQGVDVNNNFRGSAEVKKPGQRGPAGADFELSRFAAYLTAMNGDPNKRAVAAAQAYFAVRTHEAESRPAPQELSRKQILTLALEAEEKAEIERARADEQEAIAKRSQMALATQAPMVAKATAHSGVEKAIGRQMFARQVQQYGATRGVDIKQNDVYELLGRHGMCVMGKRKDRGHITAQAVRTGWGWNETGVSEDGYEYTKPLIKKKGQDLAWKWVHNDFETYGAELNPRKVA